VYAMSQVNLAYSRISKLVTRVVLPECSLVRLRGERGCKGGWQSSCGPERCGWATSDKCMSIRSEREENVF
jgi:hypothetical protein